MARLALLVGVGKYRDSSIKDLDAPAKDVEAMYALLTAPGGYGFVARNVCSLVDEAATGEKFREAIQQALLARARSGDTIVIYFSGHGTQLRDANHDEPDHLDEALMFVDSRKNASGTLRDDEFAALLEPLRAASGNVVVILDACHSGSATRGQGTDALAVRYQAPRPVDLATATTERRGSGGDESATWFAKSRPGVTTIAAAVDGTPAVEKQGQGVFTQALINVLSQTQRRPLTYRDIARKVPPLLAARSGQVPLFEGELDRVVFGSATRTRPAVLAIRSLGPPIRLGGTLLPGLGRNAELRVFASSATGTDFNDPAKSKAILVVDRSNGLHAEAHIAAAPANAEPLQVGDLAVLLRPADDALLLRVRLRPAEEPGGLPRERMQSIRQALEDNDEAARSVQISERLADFELASDGSGAISIVGPEGRVRNVVPSDAAVVENLWMHARQRAFLNLHGEGGADLSDDESLVAEVIGVDAVPGDAQPQLPCVGPDPKLLRSSQGGYVMPLCYRWRIKVSLAADAPGELRVGGVLLSSDGSILGFPADDQVPILSPGGGQILEGVYTAGLPVGIDDYLLVFGTPLDDPVDWKLLTQTARQRGAHPAQRSALHAALDRYISGSGTRGDKDSQRDYEVGAWTRTSVAIRVEPNPAVEAKASPVGSGSRAATIEGFDIRPYLPDDASAALHRVLMLAHRLTGRNYSSAPHAWAQPTDAANLALGIEGSRAIWYVFTRAGLDYNSGNRHLSAAEMLTPTSAMGEMFERCSVDALLRIGDLLVYRGAAQSGHVAMVIDPVQLIAWGSQVEPQSAVGYQIIRTKQEGGELQLEACWRYKPFAAGGGAGLSVAGRAAQVDEMLRAGDYQKAIPLAQRALRLNEALLGADHPEVARSLNQLASLYESIGESARAEPLYRRALVILEKGFGSAHPVIADVLANLGYMFYGTSDYKQAESLYRRALAIREKALGPDDPNVAQSLSALGALLRATGRYAEAESLCQRALQIVEKVRGAEHLDTTTPLNNLGLLYYTTGAYDKAEPLFQRALAISEKAYGPMHPEVAPVLSNLALVSQEKGAYQRAEPLFQRALTITESSLGPAHPDTASRLNSLGWFYCVIGAYAKAEPLIQRALAINEKARKPGHPAIAISLNALAELHRTIGAYARAEAEYRRALAIIEAALGPQHRDTAVAFNSLASLYLVLGAYEQAEPLYLRALEIRERALGPGHPETAESLSNLALLYQDTGAYDRVEPFRRRALAIIEQVYGSEHPKTAMAVANLAQLLVFSGKYQEAMSLHQRALRIRERVLGEHHDTAQSLNNLASLYGRMGDQVRAQSLYQRALEIYEKVMGAEHPDVALTLSNLAYQYHNAGDYTRAEKLYHRSLKIREKVLGLEHPDTIALLNNLSVLYQTVETYGDAEKLSEQAQSLGEANTARFLLGGSEARKRAYLQQRRLEADGYVSASLAHPSSRSIAVGMTAVLQHKGRVLDAQASSIVRLRLAAVPEDRRLFDQLAAVAQELSELILRGPGNRSSQAYRERVEALGTQQDELQSKLASRSAAVGQVVAPVTLDAVRSALPPDAVLIEWLRYTPFKPPRAKLAQQYGAPRYIAYVLKRSGELRVIDMGEAKPIETLIAKFRAALLDRTTDTRGQFTENQATPARRSVRQAAAQLSEILVKPLRPYFTEKERLLISPDGALNLVPFAALLDERGEYLTKHFEISYLTSGRDLQRIGQNSPPRSADVVLANPSYGELHAASPAPVTRSGDLDRGGLAWGPLPGTATEAKKLQSLLRLEGTQVVTGDYATEAWLRSLHGPRILHLATHGFFLEDKDLGTAGVGPLVGENPLLRSGLVLAGANLRSSEGDDGIFTAAEAAELDLVGTQLVVLSACESALGAVTAGEGVYGLRRALVLAGAQSQLSSLWKVDDRATQALMVEYYQRLLKGEGRAAALHSVQRTMLADPALQHPYHWAAFVPIGDWKPLAPLR